MQVSYIEPVGGHGGMNYYNTGLINSLDQKGVKVILYTSSQGISLLNENVLQKMYFLSSFGHAQKIFRSAKYVSAFLKSIIHSKIHKSDAIHLHFFHFDLREFFGFFITEKFFKNTISTIHDIESFNGDGKNWIAQYILKKSSSIIVHNNHSKNELTKIFKFDNTKIFVIHHGNYINNTIKFLKKDDARRKLNLPTDPPLILFIGQIKAVKGLDILIKALQKAQEKIPNVKLVIAGKVWKDDFSKYTDLIRNLKLENSIILKIGYIDDEDMSAYYASADVVVLPYKKIYQSGILLMAMSYGCPVIASDLPSMREVINHRINGYLFENNNHEDLSEKIIGYFSDETLPNKISESAVNTMIKDYSWNDIATKTIDAYSYSLK